VRPKSSRPVFVEHFSICRARKLHRGAQCRADRWRPEQDQGDDGQDGLERGARVGEVGAGHSYTAAAPENGQADRCHCERARSEEGENGHVRGDADAGADAPEHGERFYHGLGSKDVEYWRSLKRPHEYTEPGFC
jgi:hypothetical protein